MAARAFRPAPRAEIVPAAEEADVGPATGETQLTPTPKPRSGRYLLWVALLERVFEVDVSECPRCGGRLRLICAVVDAVSARRCREGASPAAPVPEARPPPQAQTTSVTPA